MNCILILVFISLILTPGMFFELLTYLFLFVGFLYSKKYLQNIFVFLVVLIIYICLFFVHYIFGNHSSAELIRLWGLTKCICTPVLVYICFFRNTFKMSSYITICCFVFILNILYGNSYVFKGIGSENCCTGLDIVLLPISFLMLTSRTNSFVLRFFIFLFIVSCYYNIFVTNSVTNQLLAILQISFFLLRKPIVLFFIKKHIKNILIFLVVIIMLSSLVVALDFLSLEADDLSTRVGIWQTAFVQFALSSSFNIVWGTGDNIVQMMSQALEVHNFMLEVLLIYGIVGFVITFIIIVSIIQALFNNKRSNKDLLALTVVSYLLICLIHPFFTGVFFFQWVSSMTILFMYNYIDK